MPALSRTYLRETAPAVCRTMAEMSNPAVGSLVKTLKEAMVSGATMPRATTPAQKVKREVALDQQQRRIPGRPGLVGGVPDVGGHHDYVSCQYKTAAGLNGGDVHRCIGQSQCQHQREAVGDPGEKNNQRQHRRVPERHAFTVAHDETAIDTDEKTEDAADDAEAEVPGVPGRARETRVSPRSRRPVAGRRRCRNRY